MSNHTTNTQWVHDSSYAYGSVGSSLRRRAARNCRCGENVVVRTVTDSLNPNCGKKFWGCRNYRNSIDKGCSYFKLVDEDDVMDERDLKIEKQRLKIEKQKKKKNKFKSDLSRTREWLIMALIFGFVCFGIVLVLGTLLACKSTSILNGFYLK
ncbi:GRF zinc finger protein [Medicago truncatula]|uniref:GRF zinc finger protein n=1 Tax=Medicago truncatula TaxID=3880 RepID=G7ZUZ1_MEDTR|nr:GRF zinc finger protein [Medicago truncatula]